MSDEAIITAIQATTMVVFGFRRYADFIGPSREQHLVFPRMLAMYLARCLTSASYPEIGRQFGGRHHTTVMNAVDSIGKKIENAEGDTAEIVSDMHRLVRRAIEKET